MDKINVSETFKQKVIRYLRYIISILCFPFATIITILYGVVFAAFYFIKKIFNVDTTKNNIEKIWEEVKRNMEKFPKIIIFPVLTIIDLLYYTVNILRRVITGNIRKINHNQETTDKMIKQAVSSVVRGETNLLNSFSRRKVNKVFTALLQIISAITTYAGFSFFLGNLNPVAPIMVTIVIQGGCYFLLNYSSTHKHSGEHRRLALLITLMLVSIFTSYTGVFNATAQPINYMKDSYNQYQESVNNMINERQLDNGYKEFNSIEIEEDFSAFESLIMQSDSSKTAAETIINNTPLTETKQDYYYDPYTGQSHNVNSTSVVQKNIDEINDMRKYIGEIDAKTNVLKEFLANYNVNNVFQSYNQIIGNQALLKDTGNKYTIIYHTFQKAIKNAKSLSTTLNKTSAIIINDVDIGKIIASSNNNAALSKLILDDFDTIKNDFEKNQKESSTFIGRINSYFDSLNKLVVSEDLINAEKIRADVNDRMSSNYSALAVYLDDNQSQKLQKLYNEALIPNTQILPLYLPIKQTHGYLGFSIISALIAVLVDGISGFISYSILPRRKSSLYYEKIEKMHNIREEMIEDCLMYICMSKMPHKLIENLSNKNDEDKENLISGIIAHIIFTVMNDFLNKVHLLYLPTQLNSYGYFSETDVEGFDEYEKRLFVTLCNISMIQPFHKDELLFILNQEFDMSSSDIPKSIADARGTEFDTDKGEQTDKLLISHYNEIFKDSSIYYCVSRNLHVWFCDSFSELLENVNMIDALDISDKSKKQERGVPSPEGKSDTPAMVAPESGGEND